jgi:hypothetical protein
LLAGEAGVGKRRLASEALDRGGVFFLHRSIQESPPPMYLSLLCSARTSAASQMD